MKENQITQGKSTYNPYRLAAILIYHRLMWDLSPIAWKSRRKVKTWQNKYKGQKAVILCNGPSLNDTDFDQLKDCFTIGLNKINLLFHRTDFRPDVVVAVNPLVLEQNQDFFNETEIPCFLGQTATPFIKNRSNIHFLHTKSAVEDRFCRDISWSVNVGATVTFLALELAFYLGFEQVTLIGCDHYFSSKGTANKVVTAGEKDLDHFDPNYFSGGMKWQLPDLARSEYNYQHAREVFEEFGRKLYNSTTKTGLDVLERMSLDEFLKL